MLPGARCRSLAEPACRLLLHAPARRRRAAAAALGRAAATPSLARELPPPPPPLPAPARRRRAEHAINTVWAKLTTMFYYPVTIEGAENLPGPDQPAVYVSNHQSFLVRGRLLAAGWRLERARAGVRRAAARAQPPVLPGAACLLPLWSTWAGAVPGPGPRALLQGSHACPTTTRPSWCGGLLAVVDEHCKRGSQHLVPPRAPAAQDIYTLFHLHRCLSTTPRSAPHSCRPAGHLHALPPAPRLQVHLQDLQLPHPHHRLVHVPHGCARAYARAPARRRAGGGAGRRLRASCRVLAPLRGRRSVPSAGLQAAAAGGSRQGSPPRRRSAELAGRSAVPPLPRAARRRPRHDQPRGPPQPAGVPEAVRRAAEARRLGPVLPRGACAPPLAPLAALPAQA